jgi:hypothetical protein
MRGVAARRQRGVTFPRQSLKQSGRTTIAKRWRRRSAPHRPLLAEERCAASSLHWQGGAGQQLVLILWWLPRSAKRVAIWPARLISFCTYSDSSASSARSSECLGDPGANLPAQYRSWSLCSLSKNWRRMFSRRGIILLSICRKIIEYYQQIDENTLRIGNI